MQPSQRPNQPEAAQAPVPPVLPPASLGTPAQPQQPTVAEVQGFNEAIDTPSQDPQQSDQPTPAQVVVQPTILDRIVHLRGVLSEVRALAHEIVDMHDVTVIPELTLAMRHIEDARMRLGVAAAIKQGMDPWKS